MQAALPPHTHRVFVLLAAVGLALAAPRGVCAAEFVETFDGREPSWQLRYGRSQPRVLGHVRSQELRHTGAAAEHIALESGRERTLVQFEHALEPSRVFDELSLELLVRSNIGGLTAWLRVTYPNSIDPRTGETLVAFVQGEIYKDVGQWQPLRVATKTAVMRDLLRRLRSELNQPEINEAHAYVDQVILTVELPPGRTDVVIDELRFGPIVAPPPRMAAAPSATGEGRDPGFPLDFTSKRLRVHGLPFFPRVIARHGEEADVFREGAFNVVWVRDLQDEATLAALERQGLWAMATPPRIASDGGRVLDANEVSVLPFTDRTRPILLFNLGTRVPPEAREDLLSWVEQIRTADRRFGRPVMADIAGDQERVVSRHVPMPGFSRHVIHTTFPLQRYRDWLSRKQLLALSGSFVWTWIQTEPISSIAAFRHAAQRSPAVIEPEQIRLQVYAALSAGCRGLGYWTTTPLDSDGPGARERRLVLAQLNLELALLEPWLAMGTPDIRPVPFEVSLGNAPAAAANGDSRRGANVLPAGRSTAREASNRDRPPPWQGELEAAVIRSEYGTLLLPVWYGRDAQFVPGQLAGREATIVVHGVAELAIALEVSPTRVRRLPQERVPGGIQVKLDVFDQTAAIVLTTNPAILPVLERRRAEIAEHYARISLELAHAKLERVERVDRELQTLGAGQPDGPDLLARAGRHIELGAAALERGDVPAGCEHSRAAMQALRILQRAHWETAVRGLSSPASSPHTICFQTLPDHWRMLAQLGRSPAPANGNLLRSGDFEDFDTMLVEGWQHAQKTIEGIRADAELHPADRGGKYALRLWAFPEAGREPPAVLTRSPVSVTSPPITVHGGQIVHIGGWVRVNSPIARTLDGALVYDSLTGPAGAVRWTDATNGWQRFELVREVHESGDLAITLALSGLGEIQFDDLHVIAHDPRLGPSTAPPQQAAAPDDSPWSGPRRLLERFPGFGPKPPRR